MRTVVLAFICTTQAASDRRVQSTTEHLWQQQYGEQARLLRLLSACLLSAGNTAVANQIGNLGMPTSIRQVHVTPAVTMSEHLHDSPLEDSAVDDSSFRQLSSHFDVNRRGVLNLQRLVFGFGVGLSNGRPSWAAVPEPTPMMEIDPSQFKRIEGGGKYADIKIGTGKEIQEGSKVVLQWVLRRSNGYFVDGSVNPVLKNKGDNFDEALSFAFTVGDGTAIPGVDYGVRGMRAGGARRLVLPIKQAYTLPIENSPGPLPKEFGPRRQLERELVRKDPFNYFFLEVEAQRVK